MPFGRVGKVFPATGLSQELPKRPSLRLLHTSDWHLGKRFFGRSLLSDHEYVLDQMINLVRDLNPDVLVVAGDVFHQRRSDEGSRALFHDTLNRLLALGTTLVFLAGPSDDFKSLHLDARWVRDAGIYLFDDATQVLSPLTLRGARDDFDVSVWCLPYPQGEAGSETEHPALRGHSLVEKVVQRLNPADINLFLGYAWTQDCGKKAELGSLVAPGGQPLEKRLLEFFDVAALGGRHEPLVLPGSTACCYSGSLLCFDPDLDDSGRSVTLYDIREKTNIVVDHYPLHPRRSLRVLEGSWEELMEQGRQVRSDDLIVLRSEEADLTPEQRADLRILGPNVVSVEFPSPFELEASEEEDDLPPVLRAFRRFAKAINGTELSDESVQLLLEVDEEP